MFYAAPELWYLIAGIFVLLLSALLYSLLKILKLKQKNYFVNRDRERYSNTLYASKDGYFAFVYPDEKINDPRKTIKERCSRRLAVILNLEQGTNSSFEDILKNFYKEDAKKIQKYTDMLLEDGVSFEDEFMLKSNKFIRLSGSRINGTDGNIYCDMIWFRDVSFETSRIIELESRKNESAEQTLKLEDLINNIPYPVWLRDEKLKLVLFNKKFAEYSDCRDKDEILEKGTDVLNVNGENTLNNIAFLAHSSNKAKKSTISLVKNGERHAMEVIETPFHTQNSLDKICTAGALIDISELDELKRNLKQHQVSQLEILNNLDTAFAVFDNHCKLVFYNKAFAELWKLEKVWLEQQPAYSAFLDVIREKRMLPEVPDYLMFKNEELKAFNKIIEAAKDMLHLPNGQSFRRVRAPYALGGLIFAFEDISDSLANTSAYNSLLALQNETLENIFDAVLIFGANGRLKFYNEPYLKLWQVDETFLKNEPSINEVLDSQRCYFNNVENWEELKGEIFGHITNITTKTFTLVRADLDKIDVSSTNLSDGSMMLIYKKSA